MSIALAVLTGTFESIAEWTTPAPPVPASDEVEAVTFPGEHAPPIFFQTDTRPVFGPPIFSAGDEALNGGWVRTQFPTRLDPELLMLYADIWWPAPFGVIELQPVTAPTLELTVHFRDMPPPGDHEFVLGRFESTALIDGIFEASGEIWAEDGRLLAQSRQTALLRPFPPSG